MTKLQIIQDIIFVNNYLIDKFVKTLIECEGDPRIKAYIVSKQSTTHPCISINLFYNDDLNKCYIEFFLNDEFNKEFNHNIKYINEKFNKNLHDNFEYDTKNYMEIILPEDGTHEICDSSPIVTPFSIGYWKSLSGRYEFLEDEIKILKDYNDMVFPKYPREYEIKKHALYTTYYKTDFALFSEKMQELDHEYNITGDFVPRKKFSEFIESVKELNMQYHQVIMNDETLNDFINMYSMVLTTYKNKPTLLKEKIHELYTSYGVITELQKKVPEIYEIYRDKYFEFFEKELSRFNVINANLIQDLLDGSKREITIEDIEGKVALEKYPVLMTHYTIFRND